MKKLGTIVSISLGLGLSGCLSMQNQPSLQALQKVGKPQGTAPWVEAFIEYRGPQEKWAGPATFLLHVSAKDSGVAKILVTPAFFGETSRDSRELPQKDPKDLKDPKDGTTAARSLAATGAAGGMTGETARNHLNGLASAMQEKEESYVGCLSPVRARLIRGDGSVLEKQGCRGQMSWPKTASEAVNQFLLSARAGN